jgi:exopolysaccharide production protein ExoQ
LQLTILRLDPVTRERIVRLPPSVCDHVLVTLWFTITFKQFRYDELLLYPLALYFAWAFVRDYRLIEPILRRSLILFAFPFWFLLTVVWANAPDTVVKSGLQLLLTIVICYCAVTRLTARQVILSMAIASLVFGVLSYDAAIGGDPRGVFSSKNALGASMVMLWASSVCVLLEARFPLLIRAAAGAAALLALQLVFASNSATAVLLSAGIALIFAAGKVLLSDGSLFRCDRLGIIFLALGIVFGGLSMIIGEMEDPVMLVLDYFGKDTTLTGRTMLWQFAEEEIAKHPLLGVGAGGFWNYYESPTVRRIYAELHMAPHASFSFHNSWYEIAVHQGLIGAAIAALTLLWSVRTLLAHALSAGGVPFLFFLSVVGVVVSRSMTEAALMAPFAQLTMLLWIGTLLAIKEREANRARIAPRPSGGRRPLVSA